MDDHDDEPARTASKPRGTGSGTNPGRSRVGLLVVGAAMLLGVDAVAFGLVRDWINGTRDLYPLLAFGIVAALVATHIVFALRALARRD